MCVCLSVACMHTVCIVCLHAVELVCVCVYACAAQDERVVCKEGRQNRAGGVCE